MEPYYATYSNVMKQHLDFWDSSCYRSQHLTGSFFSFHLRELSVSSQNPSMWDKNYVFQPHFHSSSQEGTSIIPKNMTTDLTLTRANLLDLLLILVFLEISA